MKEQVSNLHARLIAAFIDSNVIAASVLLGFVLYDYFFSPEKIWLYVITGGILLAYEPLAVSWRGQTLGHWYKNIQIVDARSGEHIGFFRALFRYIIKYTIWPLSVSWMVFSHWHHSIQDLITNSRVIAAGKIETENGDAATQFPVVGIRQVLVTMVWLVGSLWLFNAGIEWFLPQCAGRVVFGYCKIVAWIDDLGDVLIWILVFWYGSAGRLLGARLKKDITVPANQ